MAARSDHNGERWGEFDSNLRISLSEGAYNTFSFEFIVGLVDNKDVEEVVLVPTQLMAIYLLLANFMYCCKLLMARSSYSFIAFTIINVSSNNASGIILLVLVVVTSLILGLLTEVEVFTCFTIKCCNNVMSACNVSKVRSCIVHCV